MSRPPVAQRGRPHFDRTVHQQTDQERRDRCAQNGKRQNGAQIAEEVLALQRVARIEDDRRQDDVEEDLRIEGGLQVDLVLIEIDHLAAKRVRVRQIAQLLRRVQRQFAGELHPQCVGRQTLVVAGRRLCVWLDGQMDDRCGGRTIANDGTDNQS